MRRAMLTLVVLVIWAIDTSAGDASVMIGAHPISLGMHKQGVIDRLNDHYSLSCIGEQAKEESQCNYFTVMTTNPTQTLGQIAFKDNRVSMVKRSWTGFDQYESSDFARSLIQSFSTMANQNLPITSYSVDDLVTSDGSKVGEALNLVFGEDNVLTISVNRSIREKFGRITYVLMNEELKIPNWWED